MKSDTGELVLYYDHVAALESLLAQQTRLTALVEKYAAESADIQARWASVNRRLSEHDDGFYGAVDEIVRKLREALKMEDGK